MDVCIVSLGYIPLDGLPVACRIKLLRLSMRSDTSYDLDLIISV